MAWTYNLKNDTTTLNLNDGTAYKVLSNGFSAPVPSRRRSFGGENLFRHGGDLIHRRYSNRQITIRLQILGSTRDDVVTNVQNLQSLLEDAALFATQEIGSQVELVRQWDSATNTTTFKVLDGVLDVRDLESAPAFTLNTDIVGAELRLTCEPFAKGPSETLSNYVYDPSFEIAGTPLADWTTVTSGNHTVGTNARSTDRAKYGDASLLVEITDSSGSGDTGQQATDITAAPDDVWSVSTWLYIESLTGNADAELHLLWVGNGATISTNTGSSTPTGEWVKLSLENRTAPSSTTALRISVFARTAASSESIKVYFDGVYADKVASLPTAWASTRTISDRVDDDSQEGGVNYVDVYDVPGDLSALAQYRITPADREMWTGVQTGERIGNVATFEGEDNDLFQTMDNQSGDFAGSSSTETLASASDGNFFRMRLTDDGSGNTLDADTIPFRVRFDIASPLPTGTYRVLIRARWQNDTGSTVDAGDIGWAFGWTQGFNSFPSVIGSAITQASVNMVSMDVLHAVADGQDSFFQLLDLGLLTLPVAQSPDGFDYGDFSLHIFAGSKAGIPFGAGTTADWELDFVQLVPIDEGFVYTAHEVDDVASGRDWLLEGFSVPRTTYELIGSGVNEDDVVSMAPNANGTVPDLSTSGTRIWSQQQSENASGHKRHNQQTYTFLAIKLIPRYLLVR